MRIWYGTVSKGPHFHLDDAGKWMGRMCLRTVVGAEQRSRLAIAAVGQGTTLRGEYDLP